MKEKLRASMPLLGFLLCPVVTMILTELYTHDPFQDMKKTPWILNIILYWLLAAFLVMATGRLRAALRIQTLFFMLAGLANYYVIAFRSSPILPWDIYSAGTAASVADNFSYTLPARVWMVLLGFCFLLGAEQLFAYRLYRKRVRLAGLLVCTALLTAFTTFLHQESVVTRLRLYDKMFTPGVVQKRNGCAVAFAMELKYLLPDRPEGYSEEESRELLESYRSDAPLPETEELPNIIVIMDEAFADMSYVGDFTCDREVMPFVQSLTGADNVISGRLHVSVLGGNTANTEFEFLTGNTMAFLPEGSIPYQQYMRGTVPSLVSELKRFGYEAVAMHPYYASGWRRDKVYSWMGFDSMRFLEDFEDVEYVRKYASDHWDFAQIIREYEQREKDRPFFLFNVTMQNHGGYDQAYDNFEADIKAEGIESQSLSNYLSLINLTDQALQELIAYFEQEEEPVLLVFFGDHQPNDTVARPIRTFNGVRQQNITWEQEMDRYQVPFFIWANYEIEEKQQVDISANFLALEVLKQADIPAEGYYGYLNELRESCPVVSGKQVILADGSSLDSGAGKELEEMKRYRKLQYYRMFEAYKE